MIRSLSIIIPTYNEQENLQQLVPYIRTIAPQVDIILADSPSSTDNLHDIARRWDARLITAPASGRAAQMNAGASVATGEILYFVHADTRPHPDFMTDIPRAIHQGAHLGCYRYTFDHYPHPFLYINAYFTRFNKIWCRGGDQTLFLQRRIFDQLSGFDTRCLIMEDYDILQRAQSNQYKFSIIPKNVQVSARKYQTNSYWRVQWANFTLMRMFLKQNRSFAEMAKTYKNMLDYR